MDLPDDFSPDDFDDDERSFLDTSPMAVGLVRMGRETEKAWYLGPPCNQTFLVDGIKYWIASPTLNRNALLGSYIPYGWYPKSQCLLTPFTKPLPDRIQEAEYYRLNLPQWMVAQKHRDESMAVRRNGDQPFLRKTARHKLEQQFQAFCASQPLPWSSKSSKSSNQPEPSQPTPPMSLQDNPHYILSLVDESIRTIGATILGPSRTVYTFKTRLDLKVKDLVIADTANGFVIVEVTDVHEVPLFDKDIKYCWAFQKIDVEAFNAMVDRDRQALDILRDARRRTHRQEAFAEVEKMIGPDAHRMRQVLLGQGDVVEMTSDSDSEATEKTP